MDSLSIIRRRLYAQRLSGRLFNRPPDVVSWLGAMQAQEYAEAKWSIGQRVRDCTDTDVEEAFARGDILRTHLLRPTWHFVAREDIRWMLSLTAPRVHRANAYSYRQLGLDGPVLGRTLEVLAEALESGEPRTRRELATVLRGAGIDAEGLRLGYILMHAELEALICSGPRRGKQHTYALLADRCVEPQPLNRDEALAELVRRFFRSRGPATVNDFTTWSGLTVADAKEGLKGIGRELQREVDATGTVRFADATLPRDPAPRRALLVPMYDEMVMGYKDLRVVLAHPPAQDGLLRRPIVIGGLTVGSWKRTLTTRAVTIEATLFGALVPAEDGALNAVVERFGRFNDRAARLDAHVIT